jgi:hypothetical protein
MTSVNLPLFEGDYALTRDCQSCGIEKPTSCFKRTKYTCTKCNNSSRRKKYWTDEDHNKHVKALGVRYKAKKAKIRAAQQKIDRENLDKEIGAGNAICKYCQKPKPFGRFRHNRRKCRDCERDDPYARLIRRTRVRIRFAIEKKTEHLVDYLGCSGKQYLEWLKFSNPDFQMSAKWHLDHVIPISEFDLDCSSNHMIAFNWRNTMPLLSHDNLSKNNKIIPAQVIGHMQKLEEFHNQHNIEFPLIFRTLFAKHLDAGSPLEPLPPLPSGNVGEELG